jgi:hypothetical protein
MNPPLIVADGRQISGVPLWTAHNRNADCFLAVRVKDPHSVVRRRPLDGCSLNTGSAPGVAVPVPTQDVLCVVLTFGERSE